MRFFIKAVSKSEEKQQQQQQEKLAYTVQCFNAGFLLQYLTYTKKDEKKNLKSDLSDWLVNENLILTGF